LIAGDTPPGEASLPFAVPKFGIDWPEFMAAMALFLLAQLGENDFALHGALL